jgi:hypothetical protein
VDLPAQLEPVRTEEPQVQKDHVDLLIPEDLEGVLGALRRQDLVARGAEEVLEELPDGQLVIHDEELLFHGCLSL